MNMNPCVLDFEVNIKNTIGGNKASPFCPDNDIVLGLLKWDDPSLGSIRYDYIHERQTESQQRIILENVLDNCGILVGHNIKFDLLWLRRNYNLLYLDWVKAGGRVWDTQIVEYLLSGQSKTYPTLDSVSERYGGTLKDEKIKEYWNSGIDTSAIPPHELEEYLNHDVENTELVFEKQWENVADDGMLALVVTQMDALLALVEMEYNGMAFNVEGAARQKSVLEANLATKEKAIVAIMKDLLPKDMKAEVSVGSPQQLSTVLFGGKVRCIKDEPVLDGTGLPVIFKSGLRKGQTKTKKVEYFKDCVGLDLHPEDPKGKSGNYPTGDEALKKLVVAAKATPVVGGTHSISLGLAAILAEAVLEWRELAKDISTYYEGITKLVFPDGYVHPNFNQCSTATGRLSSTAPNAQNISGKG